MNKLLIFIMLVTFLAIEKSFMSEVDNMKLEFVQTIWRHGDRSALEGLFPISEKNWTFGGGGLGELTPMGMSEMNNLGTIFRRRYVEDQQFLSHRYAAKEIYIRSTNLNRTIISAMSLLYGMFPPGAWNIQGVDYPNDVDWQQGFTFIPVHVDGIDQCAVAQLCNCRRFQELQEKWAELDEVKNATVAMIALNRRVAAFYNVTDQPEKFNRYTDAWKCQRNWFNDTMYQQLPWYNEDLYNEAQRTYAPFKRFTEGNFAKPSIVDGIDIPQEVSTLQGGPLLNEIFERGREKIRCVADAENCSIDYLKPLKFYAYSSHDQLVYALLVTLGITDVVKTVDGWPDTSSSLTIEYYSNPGNQSSVKFLYRDNSNDNFSDVTSQIPVCNGAQYCAMSDFQNIAYQFKPLPDYMTLCETSLSSISSVLNNKIWVFVIIYF